MDREITEITDEENMSELIIKSKEDLEIFSKGCRDSSPLTRVQVFSLQNLSKKLRRMSRIIRKDIYAGLWRPGSKKGKP